MPAELVTPAPNTPPAANPPAEPPKPSPAAEELKNVEAIAEFFGDVVKKEDVEAAPPKEKKAKGKKDEVVTPGKPSTAPRPRTPPRPRQEPSMTPEAIAAAAAEGVARAMKPEPAAKPEPTKSPVDDLPAKEKRKVEVMQRMEKLYPDDYKDLSKRYVESLLKVSKYADEWEANHPGETFDEDAEEHRAFYDANNVDWEDHDFNAAIADMVAEKKAEGVTKEANERLSAVERAEKVREAQGTIAAETTEGHRIFWKSCGEEFADMLDKDGNVNKAKVDEIAKNDPLAFNRLIEGINQLNVEVAETYKVMHGLAPFDPKNVAHVTMMQYVADKEKAFSQLPEADQLDNEQRRFLPREKYYALPKDKRDDYWCLGFKDIKALRSADLARERLKIIEQEEAAHRTWAEARGFKVPEKAKKPAGQAPQPPPPNHDSSGRKPVTPSAGGETRLAAAVEAAGAEASEGVKSFLDL